MDENLREIFNRLNSPEFLKVLENFPVRLKNQVSQLAEYGWFIDPVGIKSNEASSLGEPYDSFIELIDDEILVNYVRDRLAPIELSIKDKFPERAHIIESAFNAHNKQKYELSIPVFFAQIDGICTKKFGGEFFRKLKKNKLKTADYVQEKYNEGLMMRALMSPLIESTILNYTEKERDNNPSLDTSQDIYSINRHRVLHGESLNYGTETNGLKVISLINYVTHIPW